MPKWYEEQVEFFDYFGGLLSIQMFIFVGLFWKLDLAGTMALYRMCLCFCPDEFSCQ